MFINTGSECPRGQCANARKSCSGPEVKPSLQGHPGSPQASGGRLWASAAMIPCPQGAPHVLMNTSLCVKGVLHSKGVVTPGGNCDSRLPFPGVLQLSATQVPAQRLRLWDWGFETSGPGSPGLGSGGGRPEQTLRHHLGGGQRENVGYKDWRHQKCSVHFQNHPGVADAGGQAGRCSAHHLCPHKRSLLPTSQCSCLGPAPLPPPCFSVTNTACCILPMCW